MRKGETRSKTVSKKSKEDIKFKNTFIIVLLVICFLQAVYIVFYTLNLKENSVKKSFLNHFVEIQKNVAMYLGEQKENMYEAYNVSQILTGTFVDEQGNTQKIKGTDGKEILPLVNTENKMDMDSIEYYIINNENIKATLKVDIPSYRNITWYITSNGDIKVYCKSKPTWWTSDLDGLIVGK